MRSYLVVANQTLASPTLATAIVERLAEGEASFHVVVPATPIQHGLTWDEAEARVAAQERLEQVLVRLKDLGASASGEVGSADPVSAAVDALRDHPVDEIILSTLPVGISRWLGLDVPASLKRAVAMPVTVVTAPRAAEATTRH